jgi:hypothetical protein
MSYVDSTNDRGGVPVARETLVGSEVLSCFGCSMAQYTAAILHCSAEWSGHHDAGAVDVLLLPAIPPARNHKELLLCPTRLQVLTQHPHLGRPGRHCPECSAAMAAVLWQAGETAHLPQPVQPCVGRRQTQPPQARRRCGKQQHHCRSRSNNGISDGRVGDGSLARLKAQRGLQVASL